MGRAIISGFKTEIEAEAYLQCMKDFNIYDNLERYILDDTEYNGEWTVNVE